MENIQDLLHRHFKTLKETRIKSGKDLQVYAIEHNLGKGLTEELGSFLRDEIKKAPLKDKHWLLWVIYASEIGYEYEGDEYWTTFEERTPKWDKSWRNLIRDWFKKFSMFYKGAVPTGEWAKHYGIICWPITYKTFIFKFCGERK